MNDDNELYRDQPSRFDNEPDTGNKHYPAAVLCRWCKQKIYVLSDEIACYNLCETCLITREKLHGYHSSVDREHSSSQKS